MNETIQFKVGEKVLITDHDRVRTLGTITQIATQAWTDERSKGYRGIYYLVKRSWLWDIWVEQFHIAKVN